MGQADQVRYLEREREEREREREERERERERVDGFLFDFSILTVRLLTINQSINHNQIPPYLVFHSFNFGDSILDGREMGQARRIFPTLYLPTGIFCIASYYSCHACSTCVMFLFFEEIDGWVGG